MLISTGEKKKTLGFYLSYLLLPLNFMYCNRATFHVMQCRARPPVAARSSQQLRSALRAGNEEEWRRHI